MAEDNVLLPRSAALAIRRLLWDIGSADSTERAQRVECEYWGAELDLLAGKAAWPTTAERTAEAIVFYERALGRLRAVGSTGR